MARKRSKAELAAINAKKNTLNLNSNLDNPLNKYPKKNFEMWIVEHPEGKDKIPGSETIVRSQHYGQAVDDYIYDWNRRKKMNRTIG